MPSLAFSWSFDRLLAFSSKEGGIIPNCPIRGVPNHIGVEQPKDPTRERVREKERGTGRGGEREREKSREGERGLKSSHLILHLLSSWDSSSFERNGGFFFLWICNKKREFRDPYFAWNKGYPCKWRMRWGLSISLFLSWPFPPAGIWMRNGR